MSTALAAVVAGLAGAALGSLANLLADRMPSGASLLERPYRRCPESAGQAVRWYDELPIIGWLTLGRRCRSSGESLPRRDLVVEALTAALAVAVVLARHQTAPRVLGVVLVGVLMPASLIDLDTRKIPNRITGPAAVLAIVLGAVLKPSGLSEQLVAGAAAAGFLFIFALIYPRGLGMGDVKLAGVLGLYLGRSVAVALFAGVISGALLGIGIMARLGVAKGRKTGIPFGPFLALGGVIGIFVGPQIVHWYVHSVSH